MDIRILILYYLSSAAGLVMVVGGIWLIYRQKIYIDRESNQITEVETPLGKFKTNVPALALFALGFVPLIYPIVQISKRPESLEIHGSVRSNVLPVGIYAVIADRTLNFSGEYQIDVPSFANDSRPYRVLIMANHMLLDDALIRPASGQLKYEVRTSEIDAGGEPNPSFEPSTIEAVPAGFQP